MRLARPSALDRISAVVSERIDDGGIGLEEREMLAFVDGVLTAAAVGPERTYPHEWMRAVFEHHALADTGMEQASITILSLLYNEIRGKLQEMQAEYAPRFLDFAEAREEIGLAGHWAVGFVTGMQLRGDAWEPLVRSKEATPLLAPIFLHLTCEDGTVPLLLTHSEEEVARFRGKSLDLLGPVVHGISRYWKTQGRRSKAAPPDASRGKIGRNEPCPCGSGKKHKKCCLARAA